MNTRDVLSVFTRYILAALLGSVGFSLFYIIFTPLTFYPAYFVLKIFYTSAQILPESTSFIIADHKIGLIGACIAGSAYLLLFVLNLVTPMDIKKRIRNLVFLCLVFLVLNIIRIVIFSALYASDFQYFDVAHKAVWYFGSTLMVVLIWFAGVAIYKIKDIPAYTDLKTLYKQIKTGKSKNRK